METKAEKLAALLKDKKVFYVSIEEPDGKGSTVETVIEDPHGVSCSVEDKTITFKGSGKTASFLVLENAHIIANRTEECDVISTFAGNGGLQIKGTSQNSI
jgi:hypothetical protein